MALSTMARASAFLVKKARQWSCSSGGALLAIMLRWSRFGRSALHNRVARSSSPTKKQLQHRKRRRPRCGRASYHRSSRAPNPQFAVQEPLGHRQQAAEARERPACDARRCADRWLRETPNSTAVLAVALGRVAFLGARSEVITNAYPLQDLFRYSSLNTRDLGAGTFLPTEARQTSTTSTGGGGDSGDLAGSAGFDSFNAFASSGVENPVHRG